MVRCYYCGSPTRYLGHSLYKCRICELYSEDREDKVLPKKLSVFKSLDSVRESALEGVVEATAAVPSEDEGIHPEMMTFVRRLTERLTPSVGYTPAVTQDILESRKEYRDDLVKVLEGKRKYQDWFDKTKTRTGLHRQTFIQYIYDALEGLTHPEAVAMRNSYEQMLSGGLLG